LFFGAGDQLAHEVEETVITKFTTATGSEERFGKSRQVGMADSVVEESFVRH
jgi:hypothetical protein